MESMNGIKFNYFLILLISLLPLSIANADNQAVFPISTEMQIGRLKNIIDKAPKGSYLTVGGERAFREASMFEGIEHLIIFDISPVVIQFNKINIELLKAPNRENYKALRWTSDFSEWKKTSDLLTEQDFKWWDENIRKMKAQDYDLPEQLNRYGHDGDKYLKVYKKLMSIYPSVSKKFNNYKRAYMEHVEWKDIENKQANNSEGLTKEEFEWFDNKRKQPNSCVHKYIADPSTAVDWGQIIDFKSGNYLFDDRLYQRLHNLALQNKITAIEADITKAEGLESITSTISKIGKKLAILDLDNLYLYDYIGEEKYRNILFKLLDFGQNNSILIVMHNYKEYPHPCAQFSIYLGFTFENVKNFPKDPFLENFFNSIPTDILPLMDGHLYEGKDELPFYLMKQ